MRKLKLISAIILTMLALLSIAACGAPQATISDIPVHPKASPLEKGKNPIADAAIDAMNKSLSEQKLTTDVKLYALPADVTWDQVKSFYTDKLNGGDWKTSTELTNESSVFSAVGWTRGGDQQALVVGYGADVLGSGSPFLMVMLATK